MLYDITPAPIVREHTKSKETSIVLQAHTATIMIYKESKAVARSSLAQYEHDRVRYRWWAAASPFLFFGTSAGWCFFFVLFHRRRSRVKSTIKNTAIPRKASLIFRRGQN